jgi:hypothetical protein
MNRDLFFIYEVFFFGTALNTESHKPPRSVGMFNWIPAGIIRANDGSRGCESCLELSVVYLYATDAVEAENRGRKEERIDEVVT